MDGIFRQRSVQDPHCRFAFLLYCWDLSAQAFIDIISVFLDLRCDGDDLVEYSQTKKEILDGYYDNGEKIYKYEPFELPFKIDDDKVYSYIDEDKWILVGTLKKSDKGKLKRSTETELYLMPNYYKRVIYDDIETEHGDAYFGLEVTLEETPKQ